MFITVYDAVSNNTIEYSGRLLRKIKSVLKKNVLCYGLQVSPFSMKIEDGTPDDLNLLKSNGITATLFDPKSLGLNYQ